MKLIDASLQFPTVIFTIGLLIALVYWLFVILGALDIDLLGGADDVSGALKGGGEALTGGDALTGGVKGAAEAVTSGAKGSAEAVHDGVDGVDGGLWAWLGLTSVPVTVSASVILLLTWVGSLLAMEYGQGTGSLNTALMIVIAIAVVLVALPIAGLIVRPLKPVFEVKVGKSNRDYVGSTCTITTGRVDDGFGQATIEDGGTVLVIPVRCDRADVLTRGARALVIDFDAARHAYVVEPATDLLPPASTDADGSV
ncbi:MAG: glycine zipper family protein [Myxococcales bacterium]|nr:glycine zipper family protein [Myxococcales bacterium]